MPRVIAHFALLASLLVAGINAARVQPLPPVRYALPGEAARGEVREELGTEIYIRTRPCEASSNVVIFCQPYAKEPARMISMRRS